MPNFQQTPNVAITETTGTSPLSATGSSPVGFAGAFQWGPVKEITEITSEIELTDTFFTPDDDTYKYFFCAADFLSYGNNLKVVRNVGPSAANATTTELLASSSSSSSGTVSPQIHNANDYEVKKDNMTVGGFAAKYPGELGNSLAIAILDNGADGVTFAGVTNIEDEFDNAAGTSTWATDRGGTDVKDEINIAVIDQDGLWTGTAGTILEKFNNVSKASDAKKPDGASNYYVNVLNEQSEYVWWLSHPEGTSNWGSKLNAVIDGAGSFDIVDSSTTSSSSSSAYYNAFVASFTGGIDDNVLQSGELYAAYALFEDTSVVDIDFLIGGPADATTAQNLVDLVDARKDCVLCISPEESDVINDLTDKAQQTTNVLDFENTQLAKSSSYVFLDSGWKYMYDRYNDTHRWIPLNPSTAGVMVQTAQNAEPWFSPGGARRGVIKNVVRLAYNPSKSQRESLYKQGINPVVTEPGAGTILKGDKTLLDKPSLFDRVNIRNLFIAIEKAISKAAEQSMFEFNDEFTRTQFKNLVEPYLRHVQASRGITAYKVVCNSENNTPTVVSNKRFVADIYVKPQHAINFVSLNVQATESEVEFNEVG